jgi:hypothetical protein
MGSEVVPVRKAPVRFCAQVAREICLRTMAGETQASICADPRMPCFATLQRWAKKHERFARVFAKARALGERDSASRSRYCPILAHEIVVRVSEGESLAAIADDPAMPALRTIYRWRHYEPGFADELAIAKGAMAERMSDAGWRLATAATPETAYLTHVRLSHLRWWTGVLSPSTHGKMKAVEPPQPAEPPDRVTLVSFETEVNPETGQVRGVSLHFDPETGEVAREPAGEWQDPAFPLVREVDYATAKRRRLAEGLSTDSDSRTWDRRPSSYGEGAG